MAATEVGSNVAPFEVGKVRPQLVSRGKTTARIVQAGNLSIGVQVAAADGGETNLHSHPNSDSAWMVLAGRAIFYTVGDRVIAELGKNEIVSIPAGTPYWFDVADKDSDENLVILHITSKIPGVSTGRIDYSARETGGENRVRELVEGKFFE